MLVSFAASAQDAWVVSTWPPQYLVETSAGNKVVLPEFADFFDLDVDAGIVCGYDNGLFHRVWLADIGRGQVLAEQILDKSDDIDHPQIAASSDGRCAIALAHGDLGILSEDGTLQRVRFGASDGDASDWVQLTYEDQRKSWLLISQKGFRWIASSPKPKAVAQITPADGKSEIEISQILRARPSPDGSRLYAVAKFVTPSDSLETGLFELDAQTGNVLRRILPYYPEQEKNYLLASLKKAAGTAQIDEMSLIDMNLEGKRLLVSGYVVPEGGGGQVSGSIVIDLFGGSAPSLNTEMPHGGRLSPSGKYFIATTDTKAVSRKDALFSTENGKMLRQLSGELLAMGHGTGQVAPTWMVSPVSQLKPMPLSAEFQSHLDEISKAIVRAAATFGTRDEFRIQLAEMLIQFTDGNGKTIAIGGNRIAALDRDTLDPGDKQSVPPFENTNGQNASSWSSFQQECRKFSASGAASASLQERRQAYCLLSSLPR